MQDVAVLNPGYHQAIYDNKQNLYNNISPLH